MLDLAVIKSTPRAGDSPPQNEKKPADRGAQSAQEQEFQTEYESTAEAPKKALKQNTETQEIPEEDSAEDLAIKGDVESEEADILIAIGESQPKQKDALGTTKGDAVTGLKTDGKTARESNEKTTPEQAAQSKSSGIEDSDGDALSSTASTGKQNGAPDALAGKKDLSGKTPAETIIMSKVVENTQKEVRTAPSDVRASTPLADTMNHSPVHQATAGAALNETKPVATKREAPLPRDAEFRVEASKPATTAATLVSVQNNSLIAKPQTLLKTDVIKEKSELTPVVTGDADSFTSWDTRSASQVSGSGLAQILNRSETPAMIARQMAEALQKLPDRPVEISLNPKELGKVRMNISAAEAGITVSIVAERPETLDLMRRNIEQLTREFQSIGYESIAFSFSEGEANQGYSDEQDSKERADTSQLGLVTEDEMQEQIHPMTSAGSGIDIRL